MRGTLSVGLSVPNTFFSLYSGSYSNDETVASDTVTSSSLQG